MSVLCVVTSCLAQVLHDALRSLGWGKICAKLRTNASITRQLCLSSVTFLVKQGEQMERNVLRMCMVSYEFGHNGLVCNEIDQRDESAVEKVGLNGANERSAFQMVAHHLWHSEECCFEGGRSTRHQRCIGVFQQRIGRRRHEIHVGMLLQIGGIFFKWDARCSGYDGLKIGDRSGGRGGVRSC